MFFAAEASPPPMEQDLEPLCPARVFGAACEHVDGLYPHTIPASLHRALEAQHEQPDIRVWSKTIADANKTDHTKFIALNPNPPPVPSRMSPVTMPIVIDMTTSLNPSLTVERLFTSATTEIKEHLHQRMKGNWPLWIYCSCIHGPHVISELGGKPIPSYCYRFVVYPSLRVGQKMLIALSQPPDDDQDASHPRLLRIISPVDETESANAAHLAPTPFHTINDDDILGPLLVPSFIMNLEVAEKVAVSSIRNGNGSAGGDESSSKLDVQPPIPSAEGQYPAGNKALHNIPPVPDTTGHISQKRPYEDPPRLLGPSLQPSSHTLPPRPLSYTYDRPDPPSLSSQWPDIDEVDMTPPTKRQRTEPGSPQRRVVDIRPRRRPRDSWVSSHYERSRRDRDMDYERSRRDMDYDREREFGRRWDEPVQTGGTVFRGRGTRHAPLP